LWEKPPQGGKNNSRARALSAEEFYMKKVLFGLAALLLAALVFTGCSPAADNGGGGNGGGGGGGGEFDGYSVAQMKTWCQSHPYASLTYEQLMAFNTWYDANATAVANSGESTFFTTWITGDGGDITYTAAADGAAGTTTSTNIALTFSAPVGELTVEDIHVDNVIGEVTTGGLSGGGTAWSLALDSVATQGDVSVSISKTGIESGVKTVAVYQEAMDGNQDLADAFTNGHNEALDLTVGTVETTDKTTVQAALTDYNDLTDAVQALLPADTGTKLQELLDKIDELETEAAADSFKTTHGETLTLTEDIVAIANKTAVEAALTDYKDLSAAVQALLTSEKSLLDTLSAKIGQLGTLDITVGFNYGAITITGSNGSKRISKSGVYGPTSLSLSASQDYTGVVWYVDGASTGIADDGSGITIEAGAYRTGSHTITFTGNRGDIPYSQLIPFTVTQ
jgi:hypothetical protein